MLVYSVIQNCYISHVSLLDHSKLLYKISEAHFKVPKFKRPKAWNKFLRAQLIFINKELNEDEIKNDQNEMVRTNGQNEIKK